MSAVTDRERNGESYQLAETMSRKNVHAQVINALACSYALGEETWWESQWKYGRNE